MVHLFYSLFPLVITVVGGYNDFSGTHRTDTDREESSGSFFALESHTSNPGDGLGGNVIKNAQENPNNGQHDPGQWGSSSTAATGTTFVSMALPMIISNEIVAKTTYPSVSTTVSPSSQQSSNPTPWASMPAPSSLSTSYISTSVGSSNSEPPDVSPSTESSQSSPVKSTTTTSMTVLITSSYQASIFSQTPTPSAAALDLSSLPYTPPVPESTSSPGTNNKVSIGMGVTASILGVSGLLAFFLWRRRNLQRHSYNSEKTESLEDQPSNPDGPTTSTPFTPKAKISAIKSRILTYLYTRFDTAKVRLSSTIPKNKNAVTNTNPNKDPNTTAAAATHEPKEDDDEEDHEDREDHEPHFSILSASQVQIIHHAHKGEASVRSIRSFRTTGTSSASLYSPSLLPSRPPSSSSSLSLGAAVAMAGRKVTNPRAVEVRDRLNVALCSNPISPVDEKRGAEGRKGTESWPLSE